MKRIYQIKLYQVPEINLLQLLGFPNPESKIYDKYFVKANSRLAFPLGFHPLVPGYDIYNLNHQLLGELIVDFIDNDIIRLLLTFYLKDNELKDALLGFIDLLIKDIEFMDFNIKGIRRFDEDKDFLQNNGPRIPKSEKKLKIWKDCYSVIQTMKDEAVNSDDLEIYIPKIADYKDRIKHDLGIDYSDKTISDIKKAGEAGLLE